MPQIELRKSAISLSALFLGLVAIWYLLAGDTTNKEIMGSTTSPKYKFHAVESFFVQGDPKTDADTFDYEKHNFGLIDRKYSTDVEGDEQRLTQWQRFEKYVYHLVKTAPAGTTYKVIYNGRHGEGYHNVGEAKYGTQAWDDYWSKLDGDGTLYWVDAHLTEKGKQQALHNNAFFARQLGEARMPAPESYYTSPLYRCCQTANLTFSGLDVPTARPFDPLIKEMLREVMGEHTCDRRSSRSVIHKAFPSWRIEEGFVEDDELWQVDHRETFAEHDVRTQNLLEDVFEHDERTFISFTSHSGAIASLLRVIGHREFRLPTGALIPLLVKATKTS